MDKADTEGKGTGRTLESRDAEGMSKALTLIEQMRGYVERHGILNVFATLLVLLVSSVFLWFILNPGAVVDRVTAIIDRRHEETVARRIEASPRIGSLLTDLRLSLDADRVFLLEAHNGSRSYSAVPFVYVDMTYETVRPGVPFLKDEYINTKIERYNFAGLLVDSPSGFWYGTVDSLEDICPELCWRLRGDSAERFAMVLMTTPSGAPYAALGLEYNPGTEARDTAEVFAAMLRCSLAAGMVLNAGK